MLHRGGPGDNNPMIRNCRWLQPTVKVLTGVRVLIRTDDFGENRRQPESTIDLYGQARNTKTGRGRRGAGESGALSGRTVPCAGDRLAVRARRAYRLGAECWRYTDVFR